MAASARTSDPGGEPWLYLVALGSNKRHGRYGDPRHVVAEALRWLDRDGLKLERTAPLISSAPLGPSRRRYCNTAAAISTKLSPAALLARLKAIERAFGRSRGGQRWAARVLDLDILLWSGGSWRSPGLTIPHPEYRNRTFVLAPLTAIARKWRDPATGLTPIHLHTRLTRSRPLPR